MADPESPPDDGEGPRAAADSERSGSGAADGASDEGGATPAADAEAVSTEELRAQVEEKYDFEDFGPAQMAEMDPEEWEAAFDPDTWVTGEALLDRVEADLSHRVLVRDVFARVERLDSGEVVAYSDQGYAAVFPDGSVEGFGTVLRDVKPVVALCSMESYDPPEAPEGDVLPEPAEVPEGGGELGNRLVQVVAGVQLLAGVGLLLAWVAALSGLLPEPAGGDRNLTLLVVAGFGFLVIGGLLFVVVANARLSDRFRAEEFRERLRAVGVDSGEYPEFLPVEDGRWVGDRPDRTGEGDEVGTTEGERDSRDGHDGDGSERDGEPETAS
ncbi:MAG: hypothetical protein ABEJ30_08875 [Halorientalis sp.]